MASNYPLSYRLSWLPRFLKPSLKGKVRDFAPASAALMSPAHSVRLAFVGDISAVANRAAPTVHPTIRDLLASADLVVGNCESPMVEKVSHRLATALGTRHAMTERFLAETLDAAGIARDRLVLSVANNHALDQGVSGFDETLAALRRLGIRVVGLAGEPVAKVAVRAAVHHGALTIGLPAFTRWRNAEARAFDGRIAMERDAAAWPLEALQECDLVCALPHWDWEFRHFPRVETRASAQRLANAGAGLIVGGHAHVVQPVERMHGTLVAYGLGDFLGTAFALQPWPIRIGALLAVDVSLDADTRGRVAGYRLHPFLRLREAGRERLVPVDVLDGRLRGKVAERLGMLYGRGAAE